MADKIISRAAARAAGLARYFTGEPCSHGHVAERNVGDRGCLDCRREITTRHNASPRRKSWMANYNRSPECKARVKARNQRPEVAAKIKAYNSEYAKRPEVHERTKRLGRERRKREHAKLGSKVWRRSLYRHANERAKASGLPFDSDAVNELLINPPTHCPIFGREFRPGGGQRNKDSPSLDRIRGELGYSRGNIALISARGNVIKNDATAAELRAVADWLERVTAD